jgi:tetratricopeptide (TPR) repeat protein
VQAGSDEFVSEKYVAEMDAVLGAWSQELRQSAQSVKGLEALLDPGFKASPLRAVSSKRVRTGAIEVDEREFASEVSLKAEAFLQNLRSSFADFSQMLTADFQVTRISEENGTLQTRILYEFVGTGAGFHREQRVGYWDVDWRKSSSGELRLMRWQVVEETLSRAKDPVFVDIAADTLGVNASYSAQLLHGSDYWRTVLDGASGIDIYGHNGVSVGDIDNDGFDDLYVCQPAGLPNRLYRNRGDGTFEDITEGSGVGILENTACALLADINNDGLQDLIVVRTNGPLLFMNQGGGKFREVRSAFKFAKTPQGTFTGAALADYDRDGWLDIYFCLYAYYQGTDQYQYPSPYYDAENGPANFLLRNNRDNTFRDVTAEAGLNQNNTRYSFCCAWNDYNGDGWPDLYVVNDFGRKNLYRNNENGTFADVAVRAGVEDVGAGMSVCYLDYDGDGKEDLYVANMWTAAGERISRQPVFQTSAPKEVRALYEKHAMGNSLLRNDGSVFKDITTSSGVGNGRWAWSSEGWDFDHDGFPELYIANGMVSGPSSEDLNSFFWRQVVAKSPEQAKPSHAYEQGWNAINELIRADGTWSGNERNVFYANNGNGTSSDISGVAGLDFREDGRSFALCDFDHDGRQEVFLKNRSGPQLRVLKNVMRELPPSISFRLRGVKSNRDAIGAVISVETDNGRRVRTLQAGSGFLSQHSKEVFFGLGQTNGPVQASIRWPSGLAQDLHDLPLNHRIWVEEGVAPSRIEPFKAAATHSAYPEQQESEELPDAVETWLLVPVTAPDFSLVDASGKPDVLANYGGKTVLLSFWATGSEDCKHDMEVCQQRHGQWATEGLQLIAVNVDEAAAVQSFPQSGFPVLKGTEDVVGGYNILYRYLFDRHRDMALPTSFLINGQQEIVKIYRGRIKAEQVEQDFRQIPANDAERITKALPFPGASGFEFGRNYLSIGSMFFQYGYYDPAAVAYQRALRDDPGSAEALYGIGSVYLQQNKNYEARETFEKVVKMRPSYPETLPNAWNNLGILATREQRMEDAVHDFEEALQISPDHLIALDNLGNAYRELKQWEEARKVLEHAVEVGPDDPEANYNLGMVYAQSDDSARAYEYLKRALQLRPVYPEALNNLGILYLHTQRPEDAVASFEECIRVAPEFDRSYLNLARVYALEGEQEKARGVLEKLLSVHPDDAQAKEMMGQLGR